VRGAKERTLLKPDIMPVMTANGAENFSSCGDDVDLAPASRSRRCRSVAARLANEWRLPLLAHARRPHVRYRPITDGVARLRMLTFLLWLLLLIFCWPLALLALVLYPFVWLLLLPFRLLGVAVEGVFELLRAIVMLPARVLRGRP
jgi:hypothetical protein